MRKWLLFCCVLLGSPRPALATEPLTGEPLTGEPLTGEPPTDKPPTEDPGWVAPPVDPPDAVNDAQGRSLDREDPEAVFRAFQLLVEQERARRITGGIGGLAVGGVTMGVGSLVADRLDTGRRPWLIMGGVTMGFSVLALIVPSRAEKLADEMGADEGNHTMEQARIMEARWQQLAKNAATERVIHGVVELTLGAGAIGGGAAILSGVGDMPPKREGVIGGLLIGFGTGLLAEGASRFFLRSPTETSYAQYQARKSAGSSLELSLGALPSGVLIGARGVF